jgi:uncharacterized protein YndB with AHSA1/START domain
MKDLIAELDLARRRVARLGNHEGPGVEGDVYDVEIRRTYEAEPADVWDACTDPERLARWFSPVTGDLKQGGRYSIDGNASGTITECDPPRRLALDWEFGDAISWVTLELSPAGADRCELVLCHRQPRTDHWNTYGPGATGVGWELTVLGLGWHLAGVEKTHAEFEASPQAKDFSRRSATLWGDAHEAAGAPAPVAAKAAQATADAFAPVDKAD